MNGESSHYQELVGHPVCGRVSVRRSMRLGVDEVDWWRLEGRPGAKGDAEKVSLHTEAFPSVAKAT
jgi:hypothetical protein